VSGLLKWCHELRERIQRPIHNFERLIDHPIKESFEMLRVRKKYDELLHLLDEFVISPFNEWCNHVGSLSNNNLEKNLLLRDPKTKTIKTNFDPQLIAVIREVKYLGLRKDQKIPDEAKSIFQQNDQYVNYITSLDYTVDSYNKIFKIATAEEMALISSELQMIDTDIEKAEKQLQWKTSGINEYIIDIRTKVSDLESRLQKTKLNVEKIQTIMSTWKDTPLFKRYEAKSTLLQLDDKQLRLNNRYKEIEESGKKIHELVNVSTILIQKFAALLFSFLTSRKINNYLKRLTKKVKNGRTMFALLIKLLSMAFIKLFYAQLHTSSKKQITSKAIQIHYLKHNYYSSLQTWFFHHH
jgi:dynein heavy chain